MPVRLMYFSRLKELVRLDPSNLAGKLLSVGWFADRDTGTPFGILLVQAPIVIWHCSHLITSFCFHASQITPYQNECWRVATAVGMVTGQLLNSEFCGTRFDRGSVRMKTGREPDPVTSASVTEKNGMSLRSCSLTLLVSCSALTCASSVAVSLDLGIMMKGQQHGCMLHGQLHQLSMSRFIEG